METLEEIIKDLFAQGKTEAEVSEYIKNNHTPSDINNFINNVSTDIEPTVSTSTTTIAAPVIEKPQVKTGTNIITPQEIEEQDFKIKVEKQEEIEEKLNQETESLANTLTELSYDKLNDKDKIFVQDIAVDYLLNTLKNDQGVTADELVDINLTDEDIQIASEYILGQARIIQAEEQAQKDLIAGLDIKDHFNNALDNAYLQGVTQTKEFWSGESEAADIASMALGNAIFGEAKIQDFVEMMEPLKGVSFAAPGAAPTLPIDWGKGLGESEEIIEKIPKYLEQQARYKPTLPIIESFKQGEYLKGSAAALGAGINILGSVGYAVSTFGSGYFFDYAAENYIAYNEGLAQRKGKSFEQLVLDGEANVWAPTGIAITQTLAEVLGISALLSPLKKTANKIIRNKFMDSPYGVKTADILGVGAKNFSQEIYQGAATTYNEVLGATGSSSKAKDAFIDHIFSQQGFEQGLQGFLGASKLRGGAYILKAANSLRAPVDYEGIEKDVNDLGKLSLQYTKTKNKTAKEGIQQKINEVKSRLDSRIIKANRIIPKLTVLEIDEINNMNDLAELQVKRVNDLHKQFEEGKINRNDYLTAIDGFKATYLDAKNRIKRIVDPKGKKVESEQQTAEEIDTTISEENKIISDKNEEATKVLLNKKSTASQIDTAKEILTTNNQGIINNIINKNYNPNLDTLLDKEEFTAAVGLEVQNLINSYGKNRDGTLKPSDEVAPFGAYLKQNLPKRIPGIFDEQIETKDGEIIGKVDVTKAKGLTEEVEVESKIKPTKEKERVFLAEKIQIPKKVIDEVIKAVEKTFVKAKIPKIGTPEFENFVKDSYRTELKPVIADLLGTREKYETFIRDNFENIYDAIPQSIINKRFPDFKQPVLDKEGKQKREAMSEAKERGAKTPGAGKPLFEKKKLSKAEFVKYFLGKDVGASTRGTRKTALAEALGEVLANEESLEILQDKNIQDKFKEIESLKDPTAVQKIDDLINYIDKTWGRKSGKLFTGPVGLITEVMVGALNTIKLAIKAGLSFAKALNKGIVYIKNKLKSEAAADVVSSNIQTLKDLQNLSTKQLNTLIENIQEAIDNEVELGKQNKAFFKDLNKINIKNLLDLSRFKFNISEKKLNEIKKNRLNKESLAQKQVFINQGKEVVSAMPKEGKRLFIKGKNSVLLQGLLGFHYRYIGSGKAPILYDNISTKNPKWVSDKTKELFKKLPEKIISANNLKDVQEKINSAKTKAEKIKIAKNNLNKIKKHQQDVDAVFYAMQSLLTDYVYSAKNENDLIKKLDYVTKIKSTNSNNINGDRALVKVSGFYIGPKGKKVKLEHVKTSSTQSIQALEQIISGDIDKNITDDFEGVYGFEFDAQGGKTAGFSKIDKVGKTNTAQYYRFKDAKDAKNYILVEYNFEGTIADKNTLSLIKNKAKASKFNNKILPSSKKLSGDFTNEMVLDKMSELDEEQSDAQMEFSKSQNLNDEFNKILENRTGIGAEKVYSDVKAQVVGASKGKFNFFIPPSAEDFVGLLYKTLGKGKLGDTQMAWYKKNLLDPFARAMDNISRDRIALMNDFKALKKELKIVPKNLKKKLPGEPFTQEQAIRTYIWNKQGITPEGMSKTDLNELTKFVEDTPELVTFADQLIELQKGDQYPAPKAGWLAGNITTDLIDGINTIKRAKYLEQWQYNVDEIFSKANLNKLEAAYGKGYRVALESILKRMRTGRNREFTSDSLTGRVTDWLTNSIGAIMFFNTRSAVLQTISAVNFINFKDNNIFAAGVAFANQPQFWKDFITLFNSDFLVDRRNGLRLNVNEADIADMAKKGGVRGVISEMLRLGFLPTQIADSFAIASGGSTFYRNRTKKYIKEGMSKAEAENKAFIDFREVAEEAQQSSRPDRISMQQAGPLGRIILAFANTPMQYARLIKKAASDLKNRRGDFMTNISKIFYYGLAQNLIFNAMQQALFAMGFGDDEEETEKREKKYISIVNSMSDSILRGLGVGGAIFSVLKNTAIKLNKEGEKNRPSYQDVLVKEIAQLSPPVSSKLSKLRAAGRSYSWNKKEIMEKGFSLDNPAYLAAGQVIAATTNIPLDRAFKKIDNIRKASSSDYEAWARIAMLAGWSDWELGVKKSESNKKENKKQKIVY